MKMFAKISELEAHSANYQNILKFFRVKLEQLKIVDNHACILLNIKNTLGIQVFKKVFTESIAGHRHRGN
jgi:hypothetical protein